jgi:hypothetical protein
MGYGKGMSNTENTKAQNINTTSSALVAAAERVRRAKQELMAALGHMDDLALLAMTDGEGRPASAYAEDLSDAASTAYTALDAMNIPQLATEADELAEML